MSGNVKHLSDENFDSSVAQGVSLVDFYADWCGPCRRVAPIIETLASEYTGKALIAKIDVDKTPQVTSRFSVTSIPTIILLKDGKEVERFVGLKDEATLKDAINKHL